MPQPDALAFEFLDDRQQPVDGVEIRLDACQLRTDMAVDPDRVDRRQSFGATIQLEGAFGGNAELAFLQTGGDIGMRAGVDIGIDAQRNGSDATPLPRDVVDSFEFRFRLDIETANAGVERLPDLPGALARTGKNRLARIASRGEHTLKFASRNDIETAAKPREHIQYRQVGIGLHGETDEPIEFSQRFAVDPVMALKRCPGIDVAGRADAVRDFGNGYVFGE